MKLFGIGFIVFAFWLSLFGFVVAAIGGQSDVAAVAPVVAIKSPALDYARIQKKCAEYCQIADQIDTRRTVVFTTVGVLGFAAGIYFLHQWLTQKEPVAGGVAAGLAVDPEVVRNRVYELQLEQLEKGNFSRIFERKFDKLVEVFLLSILVYPINRLLGSITEKTSGLLWFDGQAKTANAERTFLRDARFFYQSFLSFIKSSAVDKTEAVGFAQRLEGQIRQGVGADFSALCYTLEQSFALFLACVAQDDTITDNEKQELENNVVALCDVFNQAAHDITAVISFKTEKLDDALVAAIAIHMQELFGGCERLMHVMSMRLFGKHAAS